MRRTHGIKGIANQALMIVQFRFVIVTGETAQTFGKEENATWTGWGLNPTNQNLLEHHWTGRQIGGHPNGDQ
jgi:hypothetical protein